MAFAIFICCLAIQAASIRLAFSMARDHALPFGDHLSHVSEQRKSPVLPAIVVGVVAIAILVVNLGNAKIFLVVTSVSIVIVYIAYLLVTVPALLQRRRHGWPEDQGRTGWFFLGRRRGLLINGTAIGYGALMALNLIWPRSAIYGGGGYAWGGVIFVAALGIIGAAYYLWRQHGRDHEVADEHRVALAGVAATAPGSAPDELGKEPYRVTNALPSQARAVVIGGGVIGTSVAYHLTKLGWTDLVLLEQGQLSCGTTWHAAGLVGQLRANQGGTRLVQYSTELYSELERETGLATGFKRCGGVTVARTEARMTQLRRTAATAAAFGLECELLTPAQAADRYPVMRTDDLVGAIWLPGDGKANPVDLTASLARGARQRGARIFERTRVTRRHRRRGAGHRGAHGRGRHRGGGRGELRRAVGQAGGRARRGQRAAALRGALLRGDRPDRRRAHRPARAARPRRLHLLQGGGGRPGGRRLRARGQAVGRAGPDPLPVRVPAA